MDYNAYEKYKSELLNEATDALRDYIELSMRKAHHECLISICNAEHMAMTAIEEDSEDSFENYPIY